MNIEEIQRICNFYYITNYIINDDFSIDVHGSVNLYNRGLLKLPLRFRDVTGYFDCPWNNLTTLEGAPSMVGDNFYCDSNPLESLKGIPLGLSYEQLHIPDKLTYSDYLDYSNRVKRDFKFKKILKCQ